MLTAVIIFSLITLAVAIFLWPIAIDGTPYVASPPATIRRALRLAQVKPGELVADLGCGDGRALRLAVREFGATGLGIEINPFWVIWARRLSRDMPVTVRWTRLERADLTGVDVIYLFLVPATLNRMGQLFESLKPGGRIVSYGFALPGLTPIAVENGCYLYEVRNANHRN